MPIYFFHRTDGFVDHDYEGTELEDLDAARVQAIVFAAESLRDNPTFVWKDRNFHVEVTDVNGRILMTIVTLAIDARPARDSGESST